MADAGTIRKPDAGTLTRADLADVVHREIGLSRAEFGRASSSASSTICAHALSDGAERQDLRLRQLHPARQGRADRPQSQDRRRSADRAAPGAHLPRQPDHARADRSTAAEAAWRTPAARASRPSGRSASSPASSACPSISCAIGRRASRSCGRCSAPATAAITGPTTSRWPRASTACSTRTAIRSAASSNCWRAAAPAAASEPPAAAPPPTAAPAREPADSVPGRAMRALRRTLAERSRDVLISPLLPPLSPPCLFFFFFFFFFLQHGLRRKESFTAQSSVPAPGPGRAAG